MVADIVTDTVTELRRRLAKRGYLLADGAMGTRLMAAGLAEGALPERWNRDRAEDVVAIHASYIEAGSDIVLTNSFGGNRARLAMHGAEGELEELNMAAVACVKRAIDRVIEQSGERAVFVAGSMGPTGEMLAPLGKMSELEMEAMYYEQACALANGGADMLWIETQSDLGEMGCAMRAAARTGLPYSVTVSFDTAGSTMMGVSPEGFVDFCLGGGDVDTPLAAPLVAPWGMGLNCGLAASDTLLSLGRLTGYLRSKRGDTAEDNGGGMLVIVKGNCGVPQWRDGGFQYSGDEGMMGDYAVLARRLGADVVGSCCGSGAGHVRVMGERLGDYGGGGIPSDEEIEEIVGRAEGAVVGGDGVDAPKERRDREERRRRRGDRARDN